MMSLVRLGPEALLRDLERAFNTYVDGGGSARGASRWTPAVDIIEGAEGYRLVAELPGVRQEDVSIHLDDKTLTLAGKREYRGGGEGEKFHRLERAYGEFRRAFQLPDVVDGERITATFDQGVLTVHVPKSEGAKPRQIPIQTITNA